MRTITVPLVSVAAATPRSRLVTLDLAGHVFDFKPGQAVLIGAPDGGPPRPYSIACSPEQAAETHTLELLVGLEADGSFGLPIPEIRPGSPVEVEGPLGTFFFPVQFPNQRLLFVAGGSGIAPLRAMIDHLLRKDPGQGISLLYSARNSEEFAFQEELRGHEKRGRLELHCTVTRDESTTWSGGRGRIGRSHFERVVHEPANTMCFVCGPMAMVKESVSTLAALGVPLEAIRTEDWVVPRG